ncbi:RidA family protein [Microbacterium sp. YY-01]|uniref:RidA family protein n=1 Tax=Microbacterium sp. YY-01 TaxID=3421634 RepID=UPI003D17D017
MNPRRTVYLPGNAQPLGGYPHAHIANGTIYVSGTSSRRADNTIAGATQHPDGTFTLDIREQTAAVIDNIGTILRHAGASLDDLVTLTTYLVSMDDFAGYNEVYARYFQGDTGPARTTVAVHQLPHPQLLIEIQAIATLPTTATTHTQ